MENSKIILGLILITGIFSCNNKKSTYIDMKNDIYLRNDSIFIKKSVPNMNKENDSLYHFSYNTTLEGKEVQLKKIININTFLKLSISDTKSGVYYKDKNYVYIYNESPVYFPELNAIKYHKGKIQFLGSDYYSINNKIYFQSLEVKNANASTFVVTDSTYNGYHYAKDDKLSFYKEKQILGK